MVSNGRWARVGMTCGRGPIFWAEWDGAWLAYKDISIGLNGLGKTQNAGLFGSGLDTAYGPTRLAIVGSRPGPGAPSIGFTGGIRLWPRTPWASVTARSRSSCHRTSTPRSISSAASAHL